MMDFAPTRPRRVRGENIVPMINVVFLLLIFFLMSAQIAPPDPFEVNLPQSDAVDDMRAPMTLYISADGTLAFEGFLNTEALTQLASEDLSAPLFVRAHAALPAVKIPPLLRELAQRGVKDVQLVTGGK